MTQYKKWLIYLFALLVVAYISYSIFVMRNQIYLDAPGFVTVSDKYKTYTNEHFSFTIDFPFDWYVHENIYSSVYDRKNLSFSNLDSLCDKSDCPLDVQSFNLDIYNLQNYKGISEFYDWRQRIIKLSDITETIELASGEKVIMYIISESNTALEAQDMIRPVSNVFIIKNDSAYWFTIATGIPSRSIGQYEEIEVLKQTLRTLRF